MSTVVVRKGKQLIAGRWLESAEKGFERRNPARWDEVIGTNVGSLFAVTKPMYKQMIRQRKGKILCRAVGDRQPAGN